MILLISILLILWICACHSAPHTDLQRGLCKRKVRLGNAGLNQIKMICLLQVLQPNNTNKHFDVHEGGAICGVSQTHLKQEPLLVCVEHGRLPATHWHQFGKSYYGEWTHL